MIEIAEHTDLTCSLPAIPVEEQERIAEDLGNRLTVVWLSGDRVTVRASSWVGTVALTPDLRVRVVPKLAGNDLGVLTMLAITHGSPLHELPTYLRGLSTDTTEDATQLLCRLVVSHTERLMTMGLIRDYRSHADDLPFLRGRMDVYRQATVHYGRFAALSCSFDEFDHDTIENHLLLAGVRVARRVATDPTIRRHAADLERRLSDIAPTLPSVRTLLMSTIVYGRRTEHYRAAHIWCRSLLDLCRVDDSDTENAPRIGAFLVNMNALFERFIEWLMTHVCIGTGVNLEAQKRNSSLITVNGQARRSIAPDLVLQRAGHQAALDAKYKLYDQRGISQSDIYQLLLYAQCYTGFTATPTSYLVFPTSQNGLSETTVELTVPTTGAPRRVRIHAVGIPLAQIVAGLRLGDTVPLNTAVAAMQSVLPQIVQVTPASGSIFVTVT